ncbi:MAG: hypothetical protein JW828_01785 [Sedimentisphaerales bacterium]|nr:hypothetical protein [Sedimentisphaerales bacterium]
MAKRKKYQKGREDDGNEKLVFEGSIRRENGIFGIDNGLREQSHPNFSSIHNCKALYVPLKSISRGKCPRADTGRKV